jgi:hypothetical protein
LDRMQIYQHVLTTYANAQKSGKKPELPASIDKIVGYLQELPDAQILPVISMVVACECDPRVLEAMQKLFRERGLTAKPAAPKSQQARGPAELMATLASSED